MSVTSFYSYLVSIQSYLAKVDTENTNIQSGKSTPFDNMPTYLNKILTLVDSAKSEFLTTYLTTAQQADYLTGDFTFDEVLGNTLVTYFNTLQRIRLVAQNMLGNITATPKPGIISFFANADDYSLISEQFDATGANKVLNDSTFEYYTIQGGDTARIIANRMLGDPEKYIGILKINNITESDLLDDSLVGTEIKIPMDISTTVRYEENLVYEPDFNSIEKFMHGSDISPGINNTIAISSAGDILGESGVQVTLNSLMARVSNDKGSMNVFSPNFGLGTLGDGNEPLMVKVDRYLTDLVNQIQEDPRVESVQLDMSSLKLVDETISVKAIVSFIGSEEQREVVI